VISAINSGGGVHTDSDGITYVADTNYTAGIQSYWSPSLVLGRVPEKDRYLYTSFRYRSAPFSYNLPVAGQGQYVLILKFSDTDINNFNQHVFNVSLDPFLIIDRIDLFAKAGIKGVYDEFIYFEVCDNGQTLVYANQYSEIINNSLQLVFTPIQSVATIDAILLIKGSPGEQINFISSANNETVSFSESQCYSWTDSTSSETSVPPGNNPLIVQTYFKPLSYIKYSNVTNINLNIKYVKEGSQQQLIMEDSGNIDF
jgi:hypothetical protein